ncbi:MAG: hypothetical protein NC390_00710 [Fusobacterium sp.]|nr:hypothetical protein [Fusobacterium sp.]
MRVYAVGARPNTSCAVQKSQERVNFNGFKMHILDGGLHADTMKHFAKAIGEDLAGYTRLTMHNVETLKHNEGLKSLQSLDQALTRLAEEDIVQADHFLAIPCTAPIELNSLSRYCYGETKKLTPRNIKSRKGEVLKFLDKLTQSGSSTLRLLDQEHQGLQYLPNIIKTINQLVKKGVNVYIPADHPLEAAIKAKTREAGLSNSLYHYIATGEDKGGKVWEIIDELKNENAYKFNLLTLSDAHIVNMQNYNESGDYIFSAFDSCITDRARGVYNFCPVRNSEGRILGYSFTDKTTVQYPYKDFLGNGSIENIAKFVGKDIQTCSANGSFTHMMKNMIKFEEPHPSFPDVLYPVWEIYSPRRLKSEKLLEKGNWVDNSEQLFFDVNKQGEVVFRKCDCEGSGRPSVVSMWGSCFATINAMTRNIRTQFNNLFDRTVPKMMKEAWEHEKAGRYAEAEKILRKALELVKPEVKTLDPLQIEYNIYTQLYNLFANQKNVTEAEKVLQEAVPERYVFRESAIKAKIDELKRSFGK